MNDDALMNMEDILVTLNTSHSGRLTGVSIASSLGVPVPQIRNWMMVVADQTAERYVRRDYAAGPVGFELMRFLADKA